MGVLKFVLLFHRTGILYVSRLARRKSKKMIGSPTMKKSPILFLLALLFANTVAAAPYTLQFTSTTSSNGTYPPGASFGDSFEIYVVVDNGGATDINQTWGYSDIQSVVYSINGGSFIASFPQATFIDNNLGDIGDIQTDGAGAVSSSTASWSATSTAGNLDSNGDELEEWYVNGENDMIFYTGGNPDSVGADASTDDAGSWSVSPGVVGPGGGVPTSVPTMSAYGLALTVLGLLLVATRRLRISSRRD